MTVSLIKVLAFVTLSVIILCSQYSYFPYCPLPHWLAPFLPCQPALCFPVKYILSPLSCLLQQPFLLSLPPLHSILTYTHPHTGTLTCTHTWTCTHTHTYTHIYPCTYTLIHTWIHTQIHSCVQYCSHTHPPCTHTCISMHMHEQTHTHMRTLNFKSKFSI